ncbi:MAG: hypothetical protein LWY06_01295 [Firmicutes bacterium]|nr:hypothetical protein [Bacillota bacterium]
MGAVGGIAGGIGKKAIGDIATKGIGAATKAMKGKKGKKKKKKKGLKALGGVMNAAKGVAGEGLKGVAGAGLKAIGL